MSYTYDRAGNLKSQTYPSGRTVSYNFDPAGRLTSISGLLNGQARTYADQFNYEAQGAVRSMRLGNNLYEQLRYNNRLQPRQIGLGQTLSSSTNLTTTYCNRLLLGYQYGATASNNGNISQHTIAIPGKTYTQDYTYDGLNRLGGVTESGSASWNRTFTYDRYGNLTQSGDGVFYSSVSYDLNTNRLLSFVIPGYGTLAVDHDPAGNIRQGTTYTHDAENRITSYSGTTYAYDGEGRRVKKVSGGVTSIYVYDVQGRLAADYSSALATPARTLFRTADHLNSTRVVTKQDGTVDARYDYRPFGEELPAGGAYPRRSTSDYYGGGSVSHKFSGKERDPESGLDYFGARYYWNAAGRFSSVDSVNGLLSIPQSFNKYAYAHNNPLAYADPDGRFPWLIIGIIALGASWGAADNYLDGDPIWVGAVAGGSGAVVSTFVPGGVLVQGAVGGLVSNVVEQGTYELTRAEYQWDAIDTVADTGFGALASARAKQLVKFRGRAPRPLTSRFGPNSLRWLSRSNTEGFFSTGGKQTFNRSYRSLSSGGLLSDSAANQAAEVRARLFALHMWEASQRQFFNIQPRTETSGEIRKEKDLIAVVTVQVRYGRPRDDGK